MQKTVKTAYNSQASKAPVAQLDRVLGYEPRGQEFESLPAHQTLKAWSFDRAFFISAFFQ
jgi:hypothetical protein